MRWNRVIFALGLFMLLASSANASLIISAQSPSVGTAQVMITSNSSDDLAQFTAMFDIMSHASNAVVPVISLGFVSPADYLTDPTVNAGNSGYHGMSFASDTATVFGVASDAAGSGYSTEFAGADIYDGSAASGAVTIANGITYLLANLVFQCSAPGTTNAGWGCIQYLAESRELVVLRSFGKSADRRRFGIHTGDRNGFLQRYNFRGADP